MSSPPAYGVGIVYVPGLEPLLEAEPELVQVLEVEPQTMWLERPGQAEPYHVQRAPVERLAALPQVKLVHGVGFPIGGTRPPDPRSLGPLREMVAALDAPYASEHLAFNVAGGGDGEFGTGFMLPPRQTTAGVRAASASVRAFAAALPVPLAIETGVNYLQPREDEMSDGEFVAAVAGSAGCDVLLDLHNLYVNERNGRQRVEDAVAHIPPESVCEIHVAGGFELRGYRLDAHSGVIPDVLLELTERIVARLPNLRALTFEIGPEYLPALGLDGIRTQLARLQELWASRGAGSLRPAARPAPSGTPGDVAPREWEDTLGALVIGWPAAGELARELEVDPGLEILRELVRAVRSGMVADGLGFTTRLLALHSGAAAVHDLLDRYAAQRPPALFGATEAAGFGRCLSEEHLDVPYLDEVLGFELALLDVHASGGRLEVCFSCDPTALLTAIEAGQWPLDLPQAHVLLVLEGRPGLEVTQQLIDHAIH